jgi:hypothetical protein
MGKLNMLRRYTLRWFIIPMRQIIEHLASTHLRDYRIHMEVTSKANLICSARCFTRNCSLFTTWFTMNCSLFSSPCTSREMQGKLHHAAVITHPGKYRTIA